MLSASFCCSLDSKFRCSILTVRSCTVQCLDTHRSFGTDSHGFSPRNFLSKLFRLYLCIMIDNIFPEYSMFLSQWREENYARIFNQYEKRLPRSNKATRVAADGKIVWKTAVVSINVYSRWISRPFDNAKSQIQINKHKTYIRSDWRCYCALPKLTKCEEKTYVMATQITGIWFLILLHMCGMCILVRLVWLYKVSMTASLCLNVEWITRAAAA